MASILKVDELRGITSAGDITVTSEGGAATQSLQQGLAKAWFSAVTWATADNSLNVSSISDNATGQSTVSWSNAFADDDYTVAGSSTDADGIVLFGAAKAAGTCPVYHFGGLAGSSAYNDKEMTADFNGDLA